MVATVTNEGPGAARDAVLELTVGGGAVPLGAPQARVSLRQAQAAGLPAGCRFDASRVICDVGTIAGGASAQRRIAFVGGQTSTLDMTAHASAVGADTRISGGESRLRLAAVPAAAAGTNLPAPRFRETANLLRATGRVLVRVPGSRRFVLVRAGRQIPFGSIVDARRGSVALVTEQSAGGPLLNGTFFEGAFRISQSPSGRTSVTLALGTFRPCVRGRGRSSSAQAAQTTPAGSRRGTRGAKRRIVWAKSSGGHRTRGRSSAASVRGTLWFTADYCNGTRTVVREGSVRVRDFRTGRVVIVEAGREYFARRR